MLIEKWHKAAREWVALNSAAQMLEEGKTAFLSQQMSKHTDLPVTTQEREVKASKEWADYIKKMVRAREAANAAKIEMEFHRMRFSEAMSVEANHRAEARMTT